MSACDAGTQSSEDMLEGTLGRGVSSTLGLTAEEVTRSNRSNPFPCSLFNTGQTNMLI